METPNVKKMNKTRLESMASAGITQFFNILKLRAKLWLPRLVCQNHKLDNNRKKG